MKSGHKRSSPEGVAYDQENRRWLKFSNLNEVISANNISEIVPALKHIEERVEGEGLKAIGFIAYEGAAAFDSAFRCRTLTSFPLLWFGLFKSVEDVTLPSDVIDDLAMRISWSPSISEDEYISSLSMIKTHLTQGDTYQVNYTYRLCAKWEEQSPWSMFLSLLTRQKVEYAAYLDTGEYVICSVSPELFFSLAGDKIVCGPMKGTASRGVTFDHDLYQGRTLYNSAKNRAENIMIVDMVRNDLAPIAELGSVQVDDLFRLERYQTLWQLTSLISARTKAKVPQIFASLFPSASITGCPKVRTMELIDGFESTPRKIYTGSIGFYLPQRKAQFNVAIRTLLIDCNRHEMEYGTGGGITWDSVSQNEYQESRLKSEVLFTSLPKFALLETMLWTREAGFFLLGRHLDRLNRSAHYFDFSLDLNKVKVRLDEMVNAFKGEQARVRLLVKENGGIEVEVVELDNSVSLQLQVLRLARNPINRSERWLYHKTTYRAIYDDARIGIGADEDVLLFNEAQEITEAGNANFVARLDGRLVTPSSECGLLLGTFRAELLTNREIEEGIIRVDDLKRATELYIINSVRKWRRAILGACVTDV